MTKYALIASAVWVLAVGAYGVGYFQQLEANEVARALPTLDLMFFAFALAGPLAMLWIVVVLLNRTAVLSDTIAAQGESALTLASTLEDLNNSIDTLAETTRGRLAEAVDRVERRADESTEAFEKNFAETGARLNRVMLESLVRIDEKIVARIDAFEAMLERQRSALDERLREDSTRLTDALEGQRTAMDKRLNDDTTRLTAAIETELSSLAEMRTTLMDHIRTGLSESQATLDRGISDTLAQQETGVRESHRRLHGALDDFTRALAEVQAKQTTLIESDIAAPVRVLSREISETRKALAASPPATSEELTDLLGKSTQQILRHDRQALERLTGSIRGLETQAVEMLARIDRTSRLNPLMDPPRIEPEPVSDEQPENELPFANLPRSAPRLPVNWIAAVRALDGEAGQPGVPAAVKRATQDPDIARVQRLSDEVGAALTEDRVHLEDLEITHAPATLWHRYAKGERGPDTATLADGADDITIALVRARLRRDPEFRTLALRQADAFGALLTRAAGELGADAKLVEMADTKPGRAFILLGGLIGAFEPLRAVTGTEG